MDGLLEWEPHEGNIITPEDMQFKESTLLLEPLPHPKLQHQAKPCLQVVPNLHHLMLKCGSSCLPHQHSPLQPLSLLHQ
jgi:hypothetical protein